MTKIKKRKNVFTSMIHAHATTRRLHQLTIRSPLLVDGTPIKPVQSVRDQRIFIDADLVMRAHPCAKDGFQVLRSAQAATFNSSFTASDYVPDSYCLVGTVEAGLRHQKPQIFGVRKLESLGYHVVLFM